jgi:hypothetical protein
MSKFLGDPFRSETGVQRHCIETSMRQRNTRQPSEYAGESTEKQLGQA